MSKIRWTGAPAGIGYGFAFNDHLQATRAIRKAQERKVEPGEAPAQRDPNAAERKRERPAGK